MGCKFCEKKEVEYWFGNWCEGCRKIKNLGNVYGFDRVLEILEKCCIRNPEQLEKKITTQKKADTQTDASYIQTRSKSELVKGEKGGKKI